MSTALKICLTASELAPLAKTGGLADVTAALASFLHRSGHDVRLLMPFYSSIKTENLSVVPVDFLQDIPISIGDSHGHYSIDTAYVPNLELPIFLLRCPELYDQDGLYSGGPDEHKRFILLARASIEMCQRMGFAPDVFSCHDWHAALIPLYLKSIYAWDNLFAKSRSVLTIHNIGYQGIFSADISKDLDLAGSENLLHQDDLSAGRINFLKTGILYANLLTTVSPTYAREIQGGEYGMGLENLLRDRSDALFGILNGVDENDWNPANDPLIPKHFSIENIRGKQSCKLALLKELGLPFVAGRPLIGIVSRLVEQKGFDLMQEVLPGLLRHRDFTLTILGNGEPRYENFFRELQRVYSDRVHFYKGYNNKLAHWIEAASDMFLMPSRYEPCGLNQMYSLKYGTVPIVRETGGLADSVQLFDPATGTGTGIVFRDYNPQGLDWAMNTALDLYANKVMWRKVRKNGMAMDFSWERQGALYVELFESLRQGA